jgi:cysteine desulfurase
MPSPSGCPDSPAAGAPVSPAAASGVPIAYLDHAATSPTRREVAEAMAPLAADRFGNASGSHRVARDARLALEDAREEVASLLGARPGEVVFTGGGTESDNLAVLGVLAAREGEYPAVVCSAVEHAAVLAPARAAAGGAGRVVGLRAALLRVVPVDPTGAIDLAALEECLGDDVALVSVMLANNEVGTIQPFAGVVRIVRDRAPAAVLHTDAVQAAPYLDVAAMAAGADLVTLSAHKLGGPKGVGVLVVREGTALGPMVFGGGQERERRSGTHNVAGAVGLAVALRLAVAQRRDEAARISALRDRLIDGLVSSIPDTVESAPRTGVLPGHAHLRFAGVEQEELLVLLDEAGVCASAGSACASGAIEPSHVLLAMGARVEEARSAIRFTLGHTTLERDVEQVLAATPPAVERLRGAIPTPNAIRH